MFSVPIPLVVISLFLLLLLLVLAFADAQTTTSLPPHRRGEITVAASIDAIENEGIGHQAICTDEESNRLFVIMDNNPGKLQVFDMDLKNSLAVATTSKASVMYCLYDAARKRLLGLTDSTPSEIVYWDDNKTLDGQVAVVMSFPTDGKTSRAHGIAMDDNFYYVGFYSQYLARVDRATVAYTDATNNLLQLTDGATDTSFMTESRGFLYLAAWTTPPKLVKVDLSSFSQVKLLSLPCTAASPAPGGISIVDTTAGEMIVTSCSAEPSDLCHVPVANFDASELSCMELNNANQLQARAAPVGVDGVIYAFPLLNNPPLVVAIDTVSWTQLWNQSIGVQGEHTARSVAWTTKGAIYVGLTVGAGGKSKILKLVPHSSPSSTSTTSSSSTTTSSAPSSSSTLNPTSTATAPALSETTTTDTTSLLSSTQQTETSVPSSSPSTTSQPAAATTSVAIGASSSTSTTTTTTTTSTAATTTPSATSKHHTRTATPPLPTAPPTKEPAAVAAVKDTVVALVVAASALGAASAASTVKLQRKSQDVVRLARCGEGAPSFPPRDGFDANPFFLSMGEGPFASYRGSIVSAMLASIVVALVSLGFVWARMKVKHVNFKKGCSGVHFPGTMILVLAVYAPPAANAAATMLAAYVLGVEDNGIGDSDIYLIIASLLLFAVAPVASTAMVTHLISTYEELEPEPEKESNSGQQDDEQQQQQQQRLLQEQEQEEGLISRIWTYVGVHKRQWVVRDGGYVSPLCYFFDSFSVPKYAVWDILIAILVSMIAGASDACSSRRCCIGASIGATGLSIIHSSMTLSMWPFLIRGEAVVLPLLSATTLVTAVVGLAALALESDSLVDDQLLQSIDIISVVSFSTGLVGLILNLTLNVFIPIGVQLKKRCCGDDEESQNNNSGGGGGGGVGVTDFREALLGDEDESDQVPLVVATAAAGRRQRQQQPRGNQLRPANSVEMGEFSPRSSSSRPESVRSSRR